MDLKPFCNKCLKTQIKALVVSSCRHVLCSECYAKTTPRCCYCKAECKVIPFEKLPDEMSVYFKPILPVLKKYLKIARFQLLQRSLWTAKRKFVLERVHLMKRNATEKKERLAQLRQNYKKALQRNAELKKRLKRTRQTEPSNPFEMNSNRGRDHSPETERHAMRMSSGQKNSILHNNNSCSTPASLSFNSSSRSSLASSRNHSSIMGRSPMLNVTPRRMSSTVNSSSFFNGSSISASSSISQNTSSSSRTGQVRRLLQKSSIRSPCMNF